MSFAAGALLVVTVTHIAPESFALSGPIIAISSILTGLFLFALMGITQYFICPACSATASDKDKGFLRLGMLLIAALSIHAAMDGLAIAAGSEQARFKVTGYLILLAVSYHKLPGGTGARVGSDASRNGAAEVTRHNRRS